MTAEMIIEAEMVTANWRKKRPVMPEMKAQGTNTAHSTRAMARIGPVISAIAVMVAFRASSPLAIQDQGRLIVSLQLPDAMALEHTKRVLDRMETIAP